MKLTKKSSIIVSAKDYSRENSLDKKERIIASLFRNNTQKNNGLVKSVANSKKRKSNQKNKKFKKMPFTKIPVYDMTDGSLIKFNSELNTSKTSPVRQLQHAKSDKVNVVKSGGNVSPAQSQGLFFSQTHKTKINKIPQLISKVNRKASWKNFKTQRSDSGSVGGEIRETKKNKTLSSVMSSFDSNNGSEHLADFFQKQNKTNWKTHASATPESHKIKPVCHLFNYHLDKPEVSK